jgi:hypothetical protein
VEPIASEPTNPSHQQPWPFPIILSLFVADAEAKAQDVRH